MLIDCKNNKASPSPSFHGDLKKVNVIIGRNGSGKSKLLKSISNFITANYKEFTPLYMRNKPYNSGKASSQETIISLAGQVRQTNMQLTMHSDGISMSAEMALNIIYHSENLALQKFIGQIEQDNGLASQISQWKQNLPIARVENIFRDCCEVSVSFNRETREFEAYDWSGRKFPLENMSTGEKWILYLSMQIIAISCLQENTNTVLLVDEPESGLHEALAIDFWTRIERLFPNFIFVYATHNMNFASRDEVESLISLKSPADKATIISNVTDLDIDNYRSLIINIPLMNSNKNIVFIEAEDRNSAEFHFYSKIIGNSFYQIIPARGKNNVIKYVKSNIISKISELEDISHKGIVDKDFGETEIDNIFSLSYHDWESYLCHPDVIIAASERTANKVNYDHVVEAIIAKAKEIKRSMIVKFVNHRISLSTNSLSLSKDSFIDLIPDKIYSSFIEIFDSHSHYMKSNISIESIEDYVNSIEKPVFDNDIEGILNFYAAKPILQQVIPFTGCRNLFQYIDLIVDHGIIDEVNIISNLKSDIHAFLLNDA